MSTEDFLLIFNEHGLCLQFRSREQKQSFFADMQRHVMGALFSKEGGDYTYIVKSTDGINSGWYISTHGRLAIKFADAKTQFIFKDRIGLVGDKIMNLGSGFESQIHFNEKYFAPVLGRTLETARVIPESNTSKVTTSRMKLG